MKDKKIFVVCRAIIIDGDKMLLVQNNKNNFWRLFRGGGGVFSGVWAGGRERGKANGGRAQGWLKKGR